MTLEKTILSATKKGIIVEFFHKGDFVVQLSVKYGGSTKSCAKIISDEEMESHLLAGRVIDFINKGVVQLTN